ncbi:hypothetical protein AcV5_003795 [Taiwanofungus camphoratus]|nr:hypothetical protein AcV5_003795 [Antrodia cinnamomea]
MPSSVHATTYVRDAMPADVTGQRPQTLRIRSRATYTELPVSMYVTGPARPPVLSPARPSSRVELGKYTFVSVVSRSWLALVRVFPSTKLAKRRSALLSARGNPVPACVAARPPGVSSGTPIPTHAIVGMQPAAAQDRQTSGGRGIMTARDVFSFRVI